MVRDSGTGMSEEEISTLLNTQSQFTKYGTNQEKGTGLGLMLCKEFIKQNNGKLEIESVFNQGTIISFYLPASNSL
jgi:signal transduction histidine kinase